MSWKTLRFDRGRCEHELFLADVPTECAEIVRRLVEAGGVETQSEVTMAVVELYRAFADGRMRNAVLASGVSVERAALAFTEVRGGR